MYMHKTHVCNVSWSLMYIANVLTHMHTHTHIHTCTSSTVFPKPGIVNITVLLARNEDSCFPRFQLKVQSPIEALASSLPTHRGPRQVAMLAAAVAYLVNCDEKDKEATMNADKVISEILKDIQPADLPEWILAWLLCGEYGCFWCGPHLPHIKLPLRGMLKLNPSQWFSLL